MTSYARVKPLKQLWVLGLPIVHLALASGVHVGVEWRDYWIVERKLDAEEHRYLGQEGEQPIAVHLQTVKLYKQIYNNNAFN